MPMQDNEPCDESGLVSANASHSRKRRSRGFPSHLEDSSLHSENPRSHLSHHPHIGHVKSVLGSHPLDHPGERAYRDLHRKFQLLYNGIPQLCVLGTVLVTLYSEPYHALDLEEIVSAGVTVAVKDDLKLLQQTFAQFEAH